MVCFVVEGRWLQLRGFKPTLHSGGLNLLFLCDLLLAQCSKKKRSAASDGQLEKKNQKRTSSPMQTAERPGILKHNHNVLNGPCVFMHFSSRDSAHHGGQRERSKERRRDGRSLEQSREIGYEPKGHFATCFGASRQKKFSLRVTA